MTAPWVIEAPVHSCRPHGAAAESLKVNTVVRVTACGHRWRKTLVGWVAAKDTPTSAEGAFHEQMRAARQAAGLSQRVVAERMVDAGHPGWRQNTVCRFEAQGRDLLPGERESLETILTSKATS